MKLQKKLLVAAVALAMSAGANAAINASTTGATSAGYTGGSDLVFFAWSTGKSFVQDLGVAADSFLQTNGSASAYANASHNYSFNTSAYNSFVTGSGTNTIRWGVLAVRSDSASNGLGDVWEFSTLRTGTTAASLSGQKSSVMNGLPNSFDNFAAAATTGGYYASAGTADNWATALKANAGAKLNFNIDNTVGTTGIAFLMQDSLGATTATPQQTYFAGTWGFTGTSLDYTVAAIPEPETYGMLAAGLLMLGAVARRRKVA